MQNIKYRFGITSFAGTSMFFLRFVCVGFLLSFLSGCSQQVAHQSHYSYINPDRPLVQLGKVAIISLKNESNFHGIDENVTESVFEAIQKRQIFSLNIIQSDSPELEQLNFDPEKDYSLQELFVIRKLLGCDAIITGIITEYRPYPHLTLGLRLQLTDLTDGQLLWAYEQLWDSSDLAIVDQIEQYLYESKGFKKSRSSDQKMVTISSLKFIKFAAYQISQTIY